MKLLGQKSIVQPKPPTEKVGEMVFKKKELKLKKVVDPIIVKKKELKLKPLADRVAVKETVTETQFIRKQVAKKDTVKPCEQVYMTIKCPLKTVLKKHHLIQPIIEQTVIEMNQIVILGYQFINLYLIEKFSIDKELPSVNRKWILDVLKTICSRTTKGGRNKKAARAAQIEELDQFYENNFKNLTGMEKPSSNYKSHIFETCATQMLTCIETNISTHYIKYLSKYINCLFKKPEEKRIREETKDTEKRKEHYKHLNKEIRDLKTDLINGTKEHSDPKYHKWIDDNKRFLYPEKVTENLAYDVKAHTFSYLKHAFYINKQLEQMGERPYQVIPQRNTMTPQHITLETSMIVDIIGSSYDIFSYSTEEMNNVVKHQDHIWGQVLKLEKNSIFKNKKYTFHNQIKTDGWDCCLLFIKNKYKNKTWRTKLPDQIETYEFKQLKNLTKAECDEYRKEEQYKLVGNDPGKRHITTMTDDNDLKGTGKVFQYSACQRRRDTYTKQSAQILKTEKLKFGINKLEAVLTGNETYKTSKKKGKNKKSKRSEVITEKEKPQLSVPRQKRSLNVEVYKRFIELKNKVNGQVKSFYERDLFRKLNFRRFVRTKQTEMTFISKIQNTYLSKQEIQNGKKLVIFHGDYSRTSQMKGCVPSPNIGIKKLMSNYFIVIDVDEYLTSQKYWRTGEQMVNFKDKNGHSIHGILIPKEKPERCIHVDRDVNASRNILEISKHFLLKQERLEVFKRP